MRIWQGALRNGAGNVEVYLRDLGGGEFDLSAAVDMKSADDWHGADKVELRQSDASRHTWVARFHDHSELLIQWWHDLDELTVAHRTISFHSWGAPAPLNEAKKEAQQ